jgi:hypothetical protein
MWNWTAQIQAKECVQQLANKCLGLVKIALHMAPIYTVASAPRFYFAGGLL